MFAAHFNERLRRGNDIDAFSIIEREYIISPQRNRVRQIEFNCHSARADNTRALRAPLIAGQDQRVGNFFVRLTGPQQADSAWHGG